nr:MAG TPA: hypothetical protein [Caudoviricetes sp.]
MTGLEFKINAYKALKNICPKNQRSQNSTLDGLACDIYNIIEGIVETFKQCGGTTPVSLGTNINTIDVEDILRTHWNSLFASNSAQKAAINQAIGTHL